jgi:cobalamin biosynthetic protein CobC
MREILQEQQARLHTLLQKCLRQPVSSTALFATLFTKQANAIEQACAERGILVRRFDQPAALRFGLPGSEAQWQRLEQCLKEIQP